MSQISDEHEVSLGEWSIKVTAYKDGMVMIRPLFKSRPPTEPGILDIQVDGRKGSTWERQTEIAVEKLTRRIKLMSRMEGQRDMSLAFLRHPSVMAVPLSEEEMEKMDDDESNT